MEDGEYQAHHVSGALETEGSQTMLFIPVRDTQDAVAVPTLGLPSDPNDVLEILQAEQAPLGLWLEFAKAYLREGNQDSFLMMLEDGSSPEIEKYYADSKYERIRILVALGEFYMRQGSSTSERRTREQHYQRATEYFNQAVRIDQRELLPQLARGQLAFTRGNLDEASKLFDQVLDKKCADNMSESILPFLGKACVHYHKKMYPTALRLYEAALRRHPQGPPAIRLGIALCHFKLGNLDRAKAAFRRVLQLEPTNVEAFVGLAVSELNSGVPGSDERREGIFQGMQLVSKAYTLDTNNASILNHLAHHFLITGEYDKVLHLANAAFNLKENGPVRAESCYLIASAYHAKNLTENAEEFYKYAVQLEDDYALAHQGLAQLRLQQGNVKEALLHFERVLSKFPENLHAIKAVGSLYLATGKKEKALQALQTATRRDPQDAEALIELGEVLESSEPQEALAAYTSAIKIIKRRHAQGLVAEGPPATLLNNAAVLHLHVGDKEASRALFAQAVAAAGASVDGDEVVCEGEEATSIVYNLAHMHEAVRETEAANRIFNAILKHRPDYVECHLRAAKSESSKGNMDSAVEAASKALEVRKEHPGALAMMGSLNMMKQNWSEAHKSFKALRDLPPAEGGKPGSGLADPKSDPYATLSIANIIYYNTIRDSTKKPKDEATKKRTAEHLEQALTYYQKVLQMHPDNIYAANGVGAILAEQGKIEHAKEVFTQVQEVAAASSDLCLPDVWVNLAHIFLAQEQYNNAIKMYHNCNKKFYNNCDSQVLLYMARAYYDWDHLQECKRTLLRALHLKPTDHRLRFDIALSMQEFAFRTLNRQARSAVKKYSEVVQAVEELRLALKFFAALQHLGTRISTSIDLKHVTSHVGFCKETLEKASYILDAARKEEERAAAKREEQRQRLRAETEMRRAEEERKKAEAEIAFQQAQAAAEANEARLKSLRAQWAVGSAAADPAMDGEDPGQDFEPKRKNKSASLPAGESDSSDEEGRGNPKDSEKRALAAAGLDFSSSEDEGAADKDVAGEDDEEEEEYKDSGASSGSEDSMKIDTGEGGGALDEEAQPKKEKKKKRKKDKKDKKARRKERKRLAALEAAGEVGEDAEGVGVEAAPDEVEVPTHRRIRKKNTSAASDDEEDNDDDKAKKRSRDAVLDDEHDDADRDQDTGRGEDEDRAVARRKRQRAVIDSDDSENETRMIDEEVQEHEIGGEDDGEGPKDRAAMLRATGLDSDSDEE